MTDSRLYKDLLAARKEIDELRANVNILKNANNSYANLETYAKAAYEALGGVIDLAATIGVDELEEAALSAYELLERGFISEDEDG